MRLYLQGKSKNKIGYTPDMLTINNGDDQHNYDIQGWTDYEPTDLNVRVKGEMYKTFENGDYEIMEEEDYKELFELIKDPKSEIIITVSSESEEAENDELTDCEATLEYKDNTVSFKFEAEYYAD